MKRLKKNEENEIKLIEEDQDKEESKKKVRFGKE
jgi:hypothetical protein